jgi:hypothetical protein
MSKTAIGERWERREVGEEGASYMGRGYFIPCAFKM